MIFAEHFKNYRNTFFPLYNTNIFKLTLQKILSLETVEPYTSEAPNEIEKVCPKSSEEVSTAKLSHTKSEITTGVNFINVFTRNFYARRSQKAQKDTGDLTEILRFWELLV
jgi:hypothetical protein